nr:hypothetical protein [Tanacetum cinerariifolium]
MKTYMYNFKATVVDGTTTAGFTFFTKAVQKITGHSCSDVVQKFKATDKTQLPVEFVNTIGKNHIFQIQFSPNIQKGAGQFIVNYVLDIQPAVILSGADNRPPMLEKDMYDSWKSKMELYMMNRQHGQMILESVENGPLQADCDVKATNIILQGLPPEVYALLTHNHKQADFPQLDSGLIVPVFKQVDDPIDAINHMMFD